LITKRKVSKKLFPCPGRGPQHAGALRWRRGARGGCYAAGPRPLDLDLSRPRPRSPCAPHFQISSAATGLNCWYEESACQQPRWPRISRHVGNLKWQNFQFDQGLCPWTPLGALPPYPRYRLVLRTHHGALPTTDPFPAYAVLSRRSVVCSSDLSNKGPPRPCLGPALQSPLTLHPGLCPLEPRCELRPRPLKARASRSPWHTNLARAPRSLRPALVKPAK